MLFTADDRYYGGLAVDGLVGIEAAKMLCKTEHEELAQAGVGYTCLSMWPLLASEQHPDVASVFEAVGAMPDDRVLGHHNYLVAKSVTAFLEQPLEMSLFTARVLPYDEPFWSGFSADGNTDALTNCNGWTSSSELDTATVGASHATSDWLVVGTQTCSLERLRFVCVCRS